MKKLSALAITLVMLVWLAAVPNPVFFPNSFLSGQDDYPHSRYGARGLFGHDGQGCAPLSQKIYSR